MKNVRMSVFVLASLASGVARAQETFESVNVTPTGAIGNGESVNPAVSADGRFVAFASDSTDLVASDTNGFHDVFVRDLTTGHTEIVSVNPSGSSGNGPSAALALSYTSRIAISADGRSVLFQSAASDLVLGDTNGVADLFVRDRVTGTTERVSVTDTEGQLSRAARRAQMSADGNRILFLSNASELGAAHAEDYQLDVRDRVLGTTRRVDVLPDGTNSVLLLSGVLSPDGREVVFRGLGQSVPWPGAVFVRDVGTNTTSPLFPNLTGGPNERMLLDPLAFGPTGRWLAAESIADFDADDGYPSRWQNNLWIFDRQTGLFTCATRPTDPYSNWTYSISPDWSPSISADGSSMLFLIEEYYMMQAHGESFEVIERDMRVDAAVFATRTGRTNLVRSPDFASFDASDDHRTIAYDSFGRAEPGDTWSEQNVFVLRRSGSSASTVCAESLASCPCAQAGTPGRGCGNSFDARGAVMLARGNPSIANDTLHFTIQSTAGVAVLLQGTQLSGGGAGSPFGQGIACIGGATVPIRIDASATREFIEIGATHYAAPRLSALGSITSAGTRYYQVWYRENRIAACAATGGNLTNALAVEWRL